MITFAILVVGSCVDRVAVAEVLDAVVRHALFLGVVINKVSRAAWVSEYERFRGGSWMAGVISGATV